MLNNIQILRAFAALNVVLFHIIGASAAQGMTPRYIQFLQGWGENGVDIFFVISGFVMVVAHAQKDITPLEFMVLRIHRIVPIYWLLTLLVLAAYTLAPQLSKSIPPGSAHILASFAFLSGAIFDKPPLLYVGWTLEYEMFFYLLFSLSLLLPRGWWRLGLQTTGISLAIGGAGANPILLEFLLGVLAGELFLRRSLRAHAPLILVSGILLLSLSLFVKTEWSRVIVWGIPSLLIVWGAAASRQSDSRFLGYLGAASYSIYLAQVLTLPLLFKLSASGPGRLSPVGLTILSLSFTAATGCLLHQFAEKPLARWLKNRRLNTRSSP